MKKILTLIFPDLDDKKIQIELDESLSPKTFKAIIENLPIQVHMNKWGEEIYTNPTTVDVVTEDNARSEVDKLDVAYWPEGKALCFFFGPTPISTDGKILAYSPVNKVGKILDLNDKDILKLIKGGTDVIIKE